MNKKLLLLPLAITALGLSSCNNSNTDNWSLKRDSFTETNFETAKKVNDAMLEKQKEGISKYLNEGSITFKKYLNLNGTIRLDDLTAHDVNMSLTSGYKISWNCDKEHIKILGEKETVHVVKDSDGNYWRCIASFNGEKENKTRTNVSAEVKDAAGFGSYLIGREIGYYNTILIPNTFCISAGISGKNYRSAIGDHQYYINQLFTTDIHNKLVDLAAKYKDDEYKNQGYGINLKYGSDSADTLFGSIDGKISMEDISTAGDKGYAIVDIFSSFRNNYVAQHEFNVKGKRVSTTDESSLNYDINIVQETKKDDYHQEEVDITQYEEVK